MVKLQQNDWKHIYSILQESLHVDDTVYEQALEYLRTNKQETSTVPPLALEPTDNREFSILSLPASEGPEQLYSFYATAADNDQEQPAGKDVAACAHDLILYEIPEGLDRQGFLGTLKKQFKSHAFVLAVVSLIKTEQSARFGLVNEWLQSECSDKPTPYRWELKRNTRILYDWLEYFYDEITWDRPNHSQVIRWHEDSGTS